MLTIWQKEDSIRAAVADVTQHGRTTYNPHDHALKLCTGEHMISDVTAFPFPHEPSELLGVRDRILTH